MWRTSGRLTVPSRERKYHFSHSTRLLAATTLRNVLGTKNLSEILSEREVSFSFKLEPKIVENICRRSLTWCRPPWTRPLTPGGWRWRGSRCEWQEEVLEITLFVLERTSDFLSSSREPWLLRQRLPERQEPRWERLRTGHSLIILWLQVIAAEGEQKASRFVDNSDRRISLLLKWLQSSEGRCGGHPWESFSSAGENQRILQRFPQTGIILRIIITNIFSWDTFKLWILSAQRRIRQLYFRFRWIFLTIGWRISRGTRVMDRAGTRGAGRLLTFSQIFI